MSEKDPETLRAEKLDAAIEARNQRAAREHARQADRIMLLNDLEEKYGAQFGEENRGRTWQIVDIGGDGFLVVKRVNAVFVKQYETAMAKLKYGETLPLSELTKFAVQGLAYPEVETFRKLVNGDGVVDGAEGIASLAVLEIRRLHRNFEGELTGKT